MTTPYLTSDLPGIGGIFKEEHEDFQVTELPLYPPSGSGEHTYVQVEKQGITTLEMLRRLARAVGVAERDLGYAGLKDARGITRQTVSVPRVTPDQLLGLELPGLRILTAVRHGNKLRLGHLAGNHFRIRLRQVGPEAGGQAAAILAVLQERGVPNFFGFQRYGVQGNSALVGRHLLQGDQAGAVAALIGAAEAVTDERWQQAIAAFQAGHLAESLALFPGHCRTEREVLRILCQRPDAWGKAVKSVHPRLLKLYLSACQSELFDQLLAVRLAELDQLQLGDIACKHANGACFLVEDVADAARRAHTFEISPTGPLFGSRMLQPAGRPLELEEQVLHSSGLTPDHFNQTGPWQLAGERRPLRVPLRDVKLEQTDEALTLAFSLPKGSYATVVLREVMKTPALDGR
jgi:tRNA pseudouridine13 synthase